MILTLIRVGLCIIFFLSFFFFWVVHSQVSLSITFSSFLVSILRIQQGHWICYLEVSSNVWFMTNCSISYLKLLSNLVFSCTLLLFQLLDYIITLDKEKTNPFISVKRKTNLSWYLLLPKTAGVIVVIWARHSSFFFFYCFCSFPTVFHETRRYHYYYWCSFYYHRYYSDCHYYWYYYSHHYYCYLLSLSQ